MKCNIKKIFIWFLTISLILPSFSMAVYASEIPNEALMTSLEEYEEDLTEISDVTETGETEESNEQVVEESDEQLPEESEELQPTDNTEPLPDSSEEEQTEVTEEESAETTEEETTETTEEETMEATEEETMEATEEETMEATEEETTEATEEETTEEETETVEETEEVIAEKVVIAEEGMLTGGATFQQAVAISIDYSYSDDITDSQTENFYKINLSTSGLVKFNYHSSGMSSVKISLFDSDGNSLKNDYLYWNSTTQLINEECNWHLTAGQYYICVKRNNYSNGNYNFSYTFQSANEHFNEYGNGTNNYYADAASLTLNTSDYYKGQLAINDSIDYYKIVVPSSGRVKFSFSSQSGHMAKVAIDVYDQNMDLVENWYPSQNTTTCKIVFSEELDLVKGTYYIAIERYDSSNTPNGNYFLKVGYTDAKETISETIDSSNNSLDNADTITFDTVYRGQLAINDDKDFYKFVMSSAGPVTIKAVMNNYKSNTIHIYDSSGDEVDYYYGQGNSTSGKRTWDINLDLPKGVYYIAMVGSNTGNYTLQLTAIKYTITYYLNGGKNNDKNPVTYNATTSDVKLYNPTKTGYTFGGWYSDSKCTKKVTSIPKGSTGNKTLYAKWTISKYNVKFNGNGATSGTMKPQTSLKYGTTYSLLSCAYKRTGYSFNGWNTKADGSGKTYINKASVKNLTSTNGKTITLYAQWKKNKYSITYKLNGGKNNSKNPAAYTVTTDIKLQKPSRTGYAFSGWYSDSKFTKKVTAIPEGSTGNKTLYAKWTANKYNVKFNGNGATSGTMKTQTGLKYGTTYSLLSSAYKLTGYSFNGWNTKADGSGKAYKNKASVKNLTSTNGKTITLYAQWKKNKYSITYKLNGGKNNSKNPAAYTVTTDIKLQKPSRTGYAFSGWYSDSKFTKKVTAIPKGSTGNKTLYAKWTANKYNVKFNGNGATSGTMKTQTGLKYGTAYSLLSSTYKRTGYTFAGWNTKADGSGTTYKNKASVKNLTSTNGKTITLYAKWNINKYNIQFDGNGATSGTMKTQTGLRYSKAYTLTNNAYKRTGYVFTGWNTKKDGSGTTYTNQAQVKNLVITNGKTVTLYAQWRLPYINATSKTLYVGKTYTLKLVGTTIQSVTTSDSTVARVSNAGVVTAKNPGKTTITLKGANGKSYKCVVTVKE